MPMNRHLWDAFSSCLKGGTSVTCISSGTIGTLSLLSPSLLHVSVLTPTSPRDVLQLIKEHRRDIKAEQKRMLQDHHIPLPTSSTREELNLDTLAKVVANPLPKELFGSNHTQDLLVSKIEGPIELVQRLPDHAPRSTYFMKKYIDVETMKLVLKPPPIRKHQDEDDANDRPSKRRKVVHHSSDDDVDIASYHFIAHPSSRFVSSLLLFSITF